MVAAGLRIGGAAAGENGFDRKAVAQHGVAFEQLDGQKGYLRKCANLCRRATKMLQIIAIRGAMRALMPKQSQGVLLKFVGTEISEDRSGRIHACADKLLGR